MALCSQTSHLPIASCACKSARFASTGVFAEFVAVSPDGKSVYVTNFRINTVTQFNIDPVSGGLSLKTPATVATGFTPEGIAVAPYPACRPARSSARKAAGHGSASRTKDSAWRSSTARHGRLASPSAPPSDAQRSEPNTAKAHSTATPCDAASAGQPRARQLGATDPRGILGRAMSQSGLDPPGGSAYGRWRGTLTGRLV
jgi:hypothetical protein